MRSSLRVALLFIAAASAQRPGWRKGTWVAGVDAPAEVRETWAARPPMRGPPPDERRSPVVKPNASAAGPYRAPAPLGAPLWAEPSHRVDRDVITGLALNYKEYSHRAFVGSARGAGYRGDIVLITEPKLFRGCAEYLLCTERLAADLGALARDRGCAASVPRLHRTAASATSHHDMTPELRAELRRAYARDAALHDHYCTT